MKKYAHLILSLFLFVVSLTILYLGMRAVMYIGGSCAEGGPYVSARPCPKNVGWMLPLSIWIGFGAAAWYFYARSKVNAGPHWGYYFWSALFLSLGYNFFEFGFFHPMTDEIVWGNVICAIVFFLMGAGPVFLYGEPSIGGWKRILHLLIGIPLPKEHQSVSTTASSATAFDSWQGFFVLHLLTAGAGIYTAIWLATR